MIFEKLSVFANKLYIYFLIYVLINCFLFFERGLLCSPMLLFFDKYITIVTLKNIINR